MDTPSAGSDDLVLRVTFRNFKLSSGDTINLSEKELSPTSRLPSGHQPASDDEMEAKRKLLREARKYVRRVETQYLTRLSDAPVEFVAHEVNELRRARRDYRRLAIAIVVVVSTGMAAYKIFFSSEPVTPIFPMRGSCSGCPSNIVVNRKHKIALKASPAKGRTEWADEIIGPDGTALKVVGERADGTLDIGITVPPKAPMGTFEIPRQWHERPDVVLDRKMSCMIGFPRNGFTCLVLVDLRSFEPSASVDNLTVGKYFGDELKVAEAPLMRLNSMKTRVAMWVSHAYKADGVYQTFLVASSDPRLRTATETEPFRQKASDMKWMHVADVIVQNGKVDIKTDESSPLQ